LEPFGMKIEHLADNRMAEDSEWNPEFLKIELAKIRPPAAVTATDDRAKPRRAASNRPTRRRAAGRHRGEKVVRLEGAQKAEVGS
jgi:hypothetical protein